MATNPLHPTVEIELGDETRTLKMDFNALFEAERVTGKSMYQIGTILTRPSITDLTALVWACQTHIKEPLSLREVRALIGFHNRDEMFLALVDLVNRSFPSKSEEDGEEAESPLAPTRRRRGKNSGAPAGDGSA